MSTACPLCGGALDEAPMSVQVCYGCHAGLATEGSVKLSATGEFRAMTLPDDGGMRAVTDPGSSGQLSCTWCSRDGSTVDKLLSSGEAHICNECVALCADILDAELGEGWRR